MSRARMGLTAVLAAVLAALARCDVCTERWTRKLSQATVAASSGPNVTIAVSQIIGGSFAGNPCALSLSSNQMKGSAVGPVTIDVQQGQLSVLNLTFDASPNFLNVTNTTTSAELPAGDLQAPYDPAAGVLQVQFFANTTAVGTTATLIGGLFRAVNGSNPLQLDSTAAAPLCNFNLTFVIVNVSSGASSSLTTMISSSSNSTTVVNSQTNNGAFSTSTGTITPLPAGIPVTTNNIDGSNRGYGNIGSNNIGNGNKGDCNQGDGNIGNNNKGEGNRGDCNIGTGNVGNGWTGTGIINTSQNGPNYPCSCTLNAVAGSTG